jgi:hypothetical protein
MTDPVATVAVAGSAIERSFARATDHFLRHDRGVVVLELTREAITSSDLGELFRGWVARIAPQVRGRARGIALVAPTRWSAALIRFELWTEPVPLPTTVVRTTAQARSWAASQLA